MSYSLLNTLNDILYRLQRLHCLFQNIFNKIGYILNRQIVGISIGLIGSPEKFALCLKVSLEFSKI